MEQRRKWEEKKGPKKGDKVTDVEWILKGVQRARKRFVNLAKQDQGRTRPKSWARAGRNLSKPRTYKPFPLCLFPLCLCGQESGRRIVSTWNWRNQIVLGFCLVIERERAEMNERVRRHVNERLIDLLANLTTQMTKNYVIRFLQCYTFAFIPSRQKRKTASPPVLIWPGNTSGPTIFVPEKLMIQSIPSQEENSQIF